MEPVELRRAYDVLLAEIEAGGFGPPAADGLTAERIVAHLVVNDELMTEATEAVIAGSPFAYYEPGTPHRPQLDALVATCGGLGGLLPLLRATSQQLCALTDRLGTGSQTQVETRLHEGPELTVDEALPWGRTLDLHGRVHLPLHLHQLRALRNG